MPTPLFVSDGAERDMEGAVEGVIEDAASAGIKAWRVADNAFKADCPGVL